MSELKAGMKISVKDGIREAVDEFLSSTKRRAFEETGSMFWGGMRNFGQWVLSGLARWLIIGYAVLLMAKVFGVDVTTAMVKWLLSQKG